MCKYFYIKGKGSVDVSTLKDVVDDVKSVHSFYNKVMNWGSNEFSKKLSIILITSLFCFLTVFLTLKYYVGETEKESKKYNAEITKLSSVIKAQANAEIISICIDSIKDKNKNSAWYCKMAKEKYKSEFGSDKDEYSKDLLNKNAYEYMLFEFKKQLRVADYTYKLNTKESPVYERLKFITSSYAIVACLIIILIIFIVLFQGFRKRNLTQ